MNLRPLRNRLDRALLAPGALLRVLMRHSRRLRAWQAWRNGALRECAQSLRRLRWLTTPERRMLQNCDDAIAVLAAPAGSPTRTAARANANAPIRVLMALHSCQTVHASGYGRRSDALMLGLRRATVDVVPVLRLGYPEDIGGKRPHVVGNRGCGAGDARFLPGAGLDQLPERRYIEQYGDALRATASEIGATLIHAASNYLNGLAAASAGAALDLPVVYEVRGLWHLTRATREPGYAQSEHYAYCDTQEVRACLRADRVIVLSGAVADYLVERGVPRTRIALLPNAAEPMVPMPDRTRARQVLGLPPETKILGYVGALVDYEGLSLLIDVLADVRMHDWMLVLAGHGNEQALLSDLAARAGLADRVRFAGYLDASGVALAYRAFDVCAIPRIDTLLTRLVPSQKPYEALAYGCPTVLSPAAAAALEPALRHRFVVAERTSGEWVGAVLEAVGAAIGDAPVPTWNDRAMALRSIYRELLA